MESIPLVNEFDIASSTQNDERFGEITMSYASYDPTKRFSSETKSKFPLIIWLHGPNVTLGPISISIVAYSPVVTLFPSASDT